MSAQGEDETARLTHLVQDQLQRLLMQLSDLEELRSELEQDEYEETRADTLEQLKEFEQQLSRLSAGDMTLVSALGQVKLALQAAIKSAFKTPEVIALFARREPSALRGRLARLTEEHKLGRVAEAAYRSQAVEIIVALKRLGEELEPGERYILESSTDSRAAFEEADNAINEATVAALAGAAGGGTGAAAGAAGRR